MADEADADSVVADLASLGVSASRTVMPAFVSAQAANVVSGGATIVGVISTGLQAASGNTDAAAGGGMKLVLGYVGQKGLQASGVEPHQFVTQAILGSEDAAEHGVMKGMEEIRSQMGIPTYFSEKE